MEYFVLHCRLEHHGTSGDSLRGIGKQKVLLVNDKRFYASLSPVVEDLQSVIFRIIHQFDVCNYLIIPPLSWFVYASRIFHPLMYRDITSFSEAIR